MNKVNGAPDGPEHVDSSYQRHSTTHPSRDLLRVYSDTHARLSLGLSIFAILLFAQNLVSVYSLLTQAAFVLDQFLPFPINLAEVLAVLVLLPTTTR